VKQSMNAFVRNNIIEKDDRDMIIIKKKNDMKDDLLTKFVEFI
jgi:hypothetical protein